MKRLASGAPAAFLSASVVGLWLALGVRLVEILRFVGYELLFVVAPGLILYRILTGRTARSIEAAAVGIPLGLALEIIVETASAALGHRQLIFLVPGSALAGIAFVSTRSAPRDRPEASPQKWWAIVAVELVMLACSAALFLVPSALPRDVHEGALSGDTTYLLSIAGEAKHHWPITDPTVSGLPLAYHKFAMIDMASISSVAHIDLSVVFLRLYDVALLALLVLQIAWAGGRGRRQPWLGAAAAAFALLVGEIDVSPSLDYPFLDVSSANLVFAPSILSYVFFVPLLLLLGDSLDASRRRPRWLYAAISLFLVGVAGAKGGTVLPVLTLAVLIVLGWRTFTQRRVDRRGLATFAGLVAFSAIVYQVVYHGRSQGVSLAPFASFGEMQPLHLLNAALPDGALLHGIYWTIAFFVGLAGCVGVAGAAAIASLRPLPLSLSQVWLGSVFVASLVPLLAFDHPGLSHVQSIPYGRVAVAVLAGSAIVAAGRRVPRSVAVAALVALGGLTSLPYWWSLPPGRMLLVLDGAVLAGIVAVYAFARRRHSARTALMFMISAAAIVASVNNPTDVIPSLVAKAVRGQPLHLIGGRDVTWGMYRALIWLRTNSSPNDVLAVNNQFVGTDGTGPFNFDYSAFAERRVFLEGWAYNERALSIGYRKVVNDGVQPFPRRLELNKAVFDRASRPALATMAGDYGVRYLVFDPVAGRPPEGIEKIARLVYRNSGARVYVVRTGLLGARS